MSTTTSETRWTVQDRAWKDELPELSDEAIALLAPPVVVSAATWTAVPVPAVRKARRRIAGRAVPRAAARIG